MNKFTLPLEGTKSYLARFQDLPRQKLRTFIHEGATLLEKRQRFFKQKRELATRPTPRRVG